MLKNSQAVDLQERFLIHSIRVSFFDQGLKKLFNVQSPAEIRKMLAQQRRGRKKRSEASESSDTVTRDFGDSDELGEPEPIRPRVGSSAVKTKDGLKINLNILVDLKSPGKFAGAKSYRKLLFRENAATVEADDDGDEDVANRPIQSDEVQRSRDILVKDQWLQRRKVFIVGAGVCSWQTNLQFTTQNAHSGPQT